MQATHNVGADLTYTCIDSSTNRYEFTLFFYRDCSPGTAVSGMTQSINITSSSGCIISGGNTVTLNLVSSINLAQVYGAITDPCTSTAIQGTEEYTYTGNIPPLIMVRGQ